MDRKITTYKEMLEEEERLTELLDIQKQQLKSDLQAVKVELRPLKLVGATVKKFFTHKANQGLAAVSIKMLVDGLVKNVLLSKSGWITRAVIPFFLRNYASHVAEKPQKLVNKIKHWFRKNGKIRPE